MNSIFVSIFTKSWISHEAFPHGSDVPGGYKLYLQLRGLGVFFLERLMREISAWFVADHNAEIRGVNYPQYDLAFWY